MVGEQVRLSEVGAGADQEALCVQSGGARMYCTTLSRGLFLLERQEQDDHCSDPGQGTEGRRWEAAANWRSEESEGVRVYCGERQFDFCMD